MFCSGRGLGVPAAGLGRPGLGQGLRDVRRPGGSWPGVRQLGDSIGLRDLKLPALARGSGPQREQLRVQQQQHRQQQQQPQERATGPETAATTAQQQQQWRSDGEGGVSRWPRQWPPPEVKPRVLARVKLCLARPQLRVSGDGQPRREPDSQHRAVRVSDRDHGLPEWHFCDNLHLRRSNGSQRVRLAWQGPRDRHVRITFVSPGPDPGPPAR